MPRLALLAVALVGLLSPVAAHGASVAYIDSGNIWVSSLDGTQKHQLTTDGEWDEVAQSDNGRIAGVRRDGSKVSPLNTMRVWEANGSEAFLGTLPKNGTWGGYVYPLGLDISSDGDFLAYGYQNVNYTYPVWTLQNGVSVITARQPYSLDAVSDAGPEWPTLVGRRVVATEGGAIVVQNPSTANPFNIEYTPWAGLTPSAIPGFIKLRRTDVAATGRMIPLELAVDEGSQERRKIGVIAVASLGGPATGPADCFIPASGDARQVTLSPDGTRIAWQDGGGVWVAGVPLTADDPCVFSSPKVLISATGEYPSIGGANVADMIPAPAPRPAPVAPGTTAPTVLRVTLPASTRIAALRKGLAVRVAAPRAGLVRVTATVPGRRLGLKGAAARRPALIAKGAARVAAARVIAVKLKLTALGRAKSARLKGAKATVRVTLGTKVLTRTLRLR